jgi:hypothetical protein
MFWVHTALLLNSADGSRALTVPGWMNLMGAREMSFAGMSSDREREGVWAPESACPRGGFTIVHRSTANEKTFATSMRLTAGGAEQG